MLKFSSRIVCKEIHGLDRNNCANLKCKWSSVAQLSPYDVSCILRKNEYTKNFTQGCIKAYDSNQLASNKPIEDCRSEASLIHNNGFICGIFDGHGGASCAQVISKRLLRYIAAGLLKPEQLQEIMANQGNSQSFLMCHNDKVDFVKEIKNTYEHSFNKYTTELINGEIMFKDRPKVLKNAFLRLDEDLSKEALEDPNLRTLSVAMSGAVACVSLILDSHLYIANTGDCTAVLGTMTDDGHWSMKKMTKEHNADNLQEVQRILSEHPQSEKDTIIRNERLLGQLAPLRAFGDYRYKWSFDILNRIAIPYYGEICIPSHYHTPPYLTAMPDIEYHKLTKNDRFLVIASDGLWEFLSPTEVTFLIGEHISGKGYLQPLSLADNKPTLSEVANLLTHRKVGRKKKPVDKNAATHLIRNALGGTEYGIEHSKLSHLLSIPQDEVRLFRDDITITIIYFDQHTI